jgi:hypothetical protein
VEMAITPKNSARPWGRPTAPVRFRATSQAGRVELRVDTDHARFATHFSRRSQTVVAFDRSLTGASRWPLEPGRIDYTFGQSTETGAHALINSDGKRLLRVESDVGLRALPPAELGGS